MANFSLSVEPKPFDNFSSIIAPLPTQTTQPHQLYTQAVTVSTGENLLASPQKFVDMSDLVQGTMSPSSNTDPPEASTSLHAGTPNPPDVVESCNNSPVGNNTGLEAVSADTTYQRATEQTVSTLMDAMTPESFTLNLEEGDKKQKISKADFYKPTTGLNVEKDTSDPFSGLDPLWGLRK